MNIEQSKTGDVVVVNVRSSRIDVAAAAEFQRAVATAIGSARKVILDLSRVSFVDSSGLGVMVGLRKLLGADGRMVVAGMQPPVAALLRITRLEKVFPSYPSVDDAVAALG